MTDFLYTYILIWQLPVSLVVAALAILPIRTAYRKVRISDWDMLDHGAVEQSFMASLWIGIAAIIYPFTAVLILAVWISLIYRHIMSLRAWMASLIALTLCGFWYFIIHYYL